MTTLSNDPSVFPCPKDSGAVSADRRRRSALAAAVVAVAAVCAQPSADAGEAPPSVGRQWVQSSRLSDAHDARDTAAAATPCSDEVAAAEAGHSVRLQKVPAAHLAATPDAGLRRVDTVPRLKRIGTTFGRVVRTAGVDSATGIAHASMTRGGANPRMTSIVRAVQRGRACVVNIHSEKRPKSRDAMFASSGDRKVNGMGTGIVVDERGYIVTNYHVVQDVDSLRVTLFDGSAYPARTVSFDSRTDLAIIHIASRTPLATMPLGTSSDLMLGEEVLAIGNAFGYEHSVTRGIVSAIGRDVDVNEDQAYKNLVQTDAAINPGNSGGPLLNRNGDVIGINVAIRAGAQRIGFAIPIDDARQTIARLLSVEKLAGLYHGLATVDRKTPSSSELIVTGIEPGSPAASAGFSVGDVVTKVGSIRTTDGVDLERSLLGRDPGTPVDIEFVRSGVERTTRLTIASRGNVRSVVPRQMATAVPTADPVWTTLGLRVRPVDAFRLSQIGSNYRGGMVVTQVRPGSPAERNSVQPGDVLVGLHLWETVRRDNIDYVLQHPELATFNPLKFYIWRDGETLYGHFRLDAATLALR